MQLRYGIIPTVVLALALAACGGTHATSKDGVASLPTETTQAAPSGTSSAQEAKVDEKLSPEESVRKYNACVTAEGMPELVLPEDLGSASDGISIVGGGSLDGDGGGNGNIDFDKLQKVQDKCGHFLESAYGDFTLSPEQEAIMRDAQLAFTKCMKEKGFDVDIFGQGSDPNAPSLDSNQPGAAGGPSTEEKAQDEQAKFDDALQSCQSVFEDAGKKMNSTSGGQG